MIATKDALFSKISHCFVPHNGNIVELKKEDDISKYLTDLLNERGITIKRTEKGKIKSDSMEKYYLPAYFIEPLKN